MKMTLKTADLRWRVAIALQVSVVLILLVLHYPFGEYVAFEDVVVRAGTGNCPAQLSDVEKIKSMPNEELSEYFKRAKECADETESRIMSPIYWRSEQPLFLWFGPFKNILLLFLVCTTGIALWFWAFSASGGRSGEA